MVSMLLMFRRLSRAIRFAAKEEGFRAIFGAGVVLVISGTITYSLSQGWDVGDAFYFAVCTLTTSSIADPHLTLDSEAIKIFTAIYVLLGIGILVEIARQIGFGFVRVREEQDGTSRLKRHREG